MWQHVERQIARLNHDHRSSLKAGGGGGGGVRDTNLFVSESFYNDLISTVDMRSYND